MDQNSSPDSNTDKEAGRSDISAAQKENEGRSDNLVDFDGPGDPYNPLNWPLYKKTYTSLLYSSTSLGSVWASTA